MSAAAQLPKPEPEPTPAAAPDADGWALLEGLRRRLDDQGAQGRKTALQVSQLAESIGALVELQRRRARGLNLNSFIAYVIFTVLCGSGFYLLYRSRAHELSAARDQAVTERDAATHRADEAIAKATARDQADAKAWDIYQLLDAGKHREATTKLAELADQPLSRTERAVLAARAHETQVIAADAALKAAAAAVKSGHHAEVIAPLEAALVTEPTGARATLMHYYLGVAYAKLGDLGKAIAQLDAAIAAEVDQEDARFQLASALDRSGAFAKARAEYDRFATAHPQSQLAVFAMRRSATLAHLPAAPVLPPAKPAVIVPPAKPAVIVPPAKPAVIVPPAKPAAIAPAPVVPAPKPAAPPLPKPEPAKPVAAPAPSAEPVPEAAIELVPTKPAPPAPGELAPPLPKPPIAEPLPPSLLQPMEDTPPPPPPQPPRDPLPPLRPLPPPPGLPLPPSPDPFVAT